MFAKKFPWRLLESVNAEDCEHLSIHNQMNRASSNNKLTGSSRYWHPGGSDNSFLLWYLTTVEIARA